MKISAVLPVYNDADVVGECIASLKRQSRKFDEIIVVNDASTDPTPEVIRKFKGLRIFDFKKNRGRSNARNFGAAKANGKIVAIIESDSVYNTNWVKAVLKKFEEGADAVIDRRAVHKPKTFVSRMNDAVFTARYRNYTPFSAWAFKKNVFKKLKGFDNRLDWPEDADLGQRLLKNGYKILCAKKAVQYHKGEPKTLVEGMKRSYNFGKRMKPYYAKHPGQYPLRKLAYSTILIPSLIFPPLFAILIAVGYLHVLFKYAGNLPAKFLLAYPLYTIITEFSFAVGYWKNRVVG